MILPDYIFGNESRFAIVNFYASALISNITVYFLCIPISTGQIFESSFDGLNVWFHWQQQHAGFLAVVMVTSVNIINTVMELHKLVGMSCILYVLLSSRFFLCQLSGIVLCPRATMSDFFSGYLYEFLPTLFYAANNFLGFRDNRSWTRLFRGLVSLLKKSMVDCRMSTRVVWRKNCRKWEKTTMNTFEERGRRWKRCMRERSAVYCSVTLSRLLLYLQI